MHVQSVSPSLSGQRCVGRSTSSSHASTTELLVYRNSVLNNNIKSTANAMPPFVWNAEFLQTETSLRSVRESWQSKRSHFYLDLEWSNAPLRKTLCQWKFSRWPWSVSPRKNDNTWLSQGSEAMIFRLEHRFSTDWPCRKTNVQLRSTQQLSLTYIIQWEIIINEKHCNNVT